MSQIEPTITEFPLFSKGKVRDVYDLGDKLLMVASDRLSAFDVVLPTAIPGKGKILNQLSVFWFDLLGIKNHLISDKVKDYPQELHQYADYLEGRSMLVHKAERFDVECVARGYLVGSGWKDYLNTSAVCGHQLPADLKLCCKLDPPLFTPAAKNDTGHDENIDFERMVLETGRDDAEILRQRTLDIYSKARNYAAEKGIILADTKFEFGKLNGEIILIDEVLTPDSSRFWPADLYEEGKNQNSYDKQYIRDYLEALQWNKEAPGPELPQEVVEKTIEKYREIFVKLTGKEPNL